jgi:hypothetical protein
LKFGIILIGGEQNEENPNQLFYCNCVLLVPIFIVYRSAGNGRSKTALGFNYDKLDVAGVRTALDKGANPNWLSDTKRRYSVIERLVENALFVFAEDEKAEEKGVEILQMLFRAGAKLQPRDQGILSCPVVHGWALFTEVLLKNGANPTRQMGGVGL